MPGEPLIAVFIDFENLAMGAQVTKSVREFQGQGIGLVDIPQSRMSGKNGADIHMVVDAIDLCNSKDHIDTFALLSGDSDFSLLRLRNCAELDVMSRGSPRGQGVCSSYAHRRRRKACCLSRSSRSTCSRRSRTTTTKAWRFTMRKGRGLQPTSEKRSS